MLVTNKMLAPILLSSVTNINFGIGPTLSQWFGIKNVKVPKNREFGVSVKKMVNMPTSGPNVNFKKLFFKMLEIMP